MEDRACLNCGSLIEEGTLQLTKNGDKVDTQCPICYAKNQDITLRDLLEIESVRKEVMKLEWRPVE